MTCVGYSVGRHWECLALLQPVQHVVPVEITDTATAADASVRPDDGSVTVASTTAASQADAAYRRSNTGGASSTVGGGTSSFAESGGGGGSTMVSFQLSSLQSTTGGGGNSSPPDMNTTLRKPSGQVVVRPVLNVAGNVPQEEGTLEAEPLEYVIRLDARPLAPTLIEFSPQDDKSSWGVLIGSSDHSKLSWLSPSKTEAVLEQTVLDDPAFTFPSPVMAMDYLCLDSAVSTTETADDDDESPQEQSTDAFCVAVACQDGTIRLILCDYQQETQLFGNCRHAQVVVDGPIVCVSLQHGRRESSVHLTAGSLCGYAMELTLSLLPPTTESSDSPVLLQEQLTGPSMVAPDLWSEALSAEDSVLAVHACCDTVVLGTFCGRVLVYSRQQREEQQDDDKDDTGSYHLKWTCQLPYSIHGVCMTPASATTPHACQIVVTTRRSIHVFCECAESSADADARASADARKERLLQLLRPPESSNEDSLAEASEASDVDGTHAEEPSVTTEPTVPTNETGPTTSSESIVP